MEQIKRCLVTGASGFVGKTLCKELKKQGILSIRALMRNTALAQTANLPWDEVVSFDFNQLNEKQLPIECMQDVDTVFHLAGIAHAYASSEEYQRINVIATENLLEAAVSKGVRKFIYFSSIKAIEPSDKYGHSKVAAEQKVLEYGRKYSLHVCILRPALVYGPGVKGNLLGMMQSLTQGFFPPVPETHNRLSMIAVADLVQAAIIAATDSRAKNQVFTLTDNLAYSTRQILDATREALGLSKLKWSLPVWVYRLVFCFLLRKPYLFYRLFGTRYYESKEIEKVLDFKPRATFYSTVKEQVEFYLQSK